MRVRIGDLTVALAAAGGSLGDEWEQLFAGWQSAAEPDLHLSLALVEALPPLPERSPLFVDPRGIVDVYVDRESHLLHFHSGAAVRLGRDHAGGAITAAALAGGQLEDVTYTSLAPLLRARGYFLLHAFAAARDGVAILLCGRSGSGKTTTGANLLLNGWQLLANDVLLLREQAGAVYALPTPGPVRVRPPTLLLLPALRHRRGRPHAPTASYIFPAESISDGWAAPAPVGALYFPQIDGAAEQNHVQPLARAVALAHLLEESVDRWDRAAMADHLALLQRLAEQAGAYRLHLGSDVNSLPSLLAAGPEETS
jgi:hypothetical protein